MYRNICLLISMLGGIACSTQHYQVDSTSTMEMPPVKHKVKALSGRINGYSLYLKNMDKERRLSIDWKQVKIRQTDGFEISTAVDVYQPVETIDPGGSIQYHIQPNHKYRLSTPHRDTNSLYWKDLSAWPAMTQMLIIPYCLHDRKTDQKSCNTGGIVIKQTAHRKLQAEELNTWRNQTVYSANYKSLFDVQIGRRYNILDTYQSFNGIWNTNLGLGFHLHDRVRLGLNWDFPSVVTIKNKVKLKEFSTVNIGADLTALKIGLVEFGVSTYFVQVTSKYSTPDLASGVLEWEQSNPFLTTGGFLKVNFPYHIFLMATGEHSFSLGKKTITSGDDDQELRDNNMIQSSSGLQRFAIQVGWAF